MYNILTFYLVRRIIVLNKTKQNKFSKVENLSTNEKMLHGTAWLSIGLLISRIIGALYIIPWSRWIGEHYNVANGLYALAYAPYILFLDIATAGFPLAITKQISQLNARGEYKASMSLFKNSMLIMIGLGAFSCLTFYGLADYIASISVVPTGNVNDSVLILRSLAPAILIIPPISLLRGFFQGFQQMTTPALSQILEQVVRVSYMLGATFYIMKIAKGSLVEAVSQSTFAAFIGAFVTLIFLLFELYKERYYIFEKIKLGKQTVSFSILDSFKLVLKDSIPFVVMSTGTSLLALIDNFSYNGIMNEFSTMTKDEIANSFAWFSANAAKLTNIVGSITMAITASAIPNIAALYHRKDKKQLSLAVTKDIELLCFLVIPSAIGLFIVSNAIYAVFYGSIDGAHVLKIFCINLIITGFFSMFVSIIQSTGKHMIAIKSLSILLLSKLTFTLILTAIFKENGPGLSSVVATILATIYLFDELFKLTKFDTTYIIKKTTNIIFATLAMTAISLIIYNILVILLPANNNMANLFIVFITAIFGGLTYIYFTLKLNIMDSILPKQALQFRRLLKKWNL
ncbi:oligosaccharide flippase family protein [Granulicatella sp. zg-84]|nr:oligosaccharide flippase family protein [Granulicatella sp. zg-84]